MVIFPHGLSQCCLPSPNLGEISRLLFMYILHKDNKIDINMALAFHYSLKKIERQLGADEESKYLNLCVKYYC